MTPDTVTDDPAEYRGSGHVSAAFTKWQNTRDPSDLHGVVKALDPMISYRVAAYGGADNPKMLHQAKLIAADAIRRYDPASGAKLASWVQTNLQGLNRYRRESQGPVKVPERAQLDAWHIERTSREFLDEHGREPDVKELADATKLSLKRISDVRKATRPVGSEAQAMSAPINSSVDFLGEAMEYLYDDLDYRDRRIIELTTGYGGSEVLPKNVVAQRLGISPSQVTRRSEEIARRLEALENDLQEVHA